MSMFSEARYIGQNHAVPVMLDNMQHAANCVRVYQYWDRCSPDNSSRKVGPWYRKLVHAMVMTWFPLHEAEMNPRQSLCHWVTGEEFVLTLSSASLYTVP